MYCGVSAEVQELRRMVEALTKRVASFEDAKRLRRSNEGLVSSNDERWREEYEPPAPRA